MQRHTVAPRLVSWLVLLFGLAEVPWVIYLIFNQQATVEADHLRLCQPGAGIRSRHPVRRCRLVSLEPATLGGGTVRFGRNCDSLLAIMVTLSPDMETAGVQGMFVLLLIAIPGAVAAGLATSHVLHGSAESHRMLMLVSATVLAVIALSFLVHTTGRLMDEGTTVWMSRARAIVVILDTGETVALIGAGLASLRARRAPHLCSGPSQPHLLTGDAFANVVGAPQGPAFQQAIFYLIVGEIPSIVLSLVVVHSASRRLASSTSPVADEVIEIPPAVERQER